MGEGSETSYLCLHNPLRITWQKAEIGESFLNSDDATTLTHFHTNNISFK